MHSQQEKSLRNFEKEPSSQVDTKDFVSDVIVIAEPEMDTPAEAPP
jgi:hypothetical protein